MTSSLASVSYFLSLTSLGLHLDSAASETLFSKAGVLLYHGMKHMDSGVV